MKRAFSIFAAIALVSTIAAAAMAQSNNGIGQGARYGSGLPNAGEVAGFDNRYLDRHPEVARQLSHNPGLVDNPQFLATHPGLDGYLAHHPELRTALQQHPDRFMHDEHYYEQFENRVSAPQGSHGYPNAGEGAGFDNRYLDRHPEVARQLSHNPGLVDNPQFLATHPGLDNYLAGHPGVRTELQQHPDQFMNAEQKYEHYENGPNTRDRGTLHPAAYVRRANKHRAD